MNQLDKIKDTDGAMIVFQSIVVDDVGIVISMKDGKWSMAVSGKTKELVVDLDFIDDMIDNAIAATRERDIERHVEAIIKLIRQGEFSGSFSDGCDCDKCDRYEKIASKKIIEALNNEECSHGHEHPKWDRRHKEFYCNDCGKTLLK